MTSTPRLLLVEDELPLVTLLDYNLKSAGYELTVAMDGDTAISMAIEQQPDLILLDWMLPDLLVEA